MKPTIPNKKNIVSIVFVFFLSTSSSFGVTINVPGDEPTIADAVSAAQPGDVIVIAPGTYIEQSKILIDKQLTISSQWHTTGDKQFIDQTVLDGVDKSHGLFETVDNLGVDVEISGLTFKRFRKPIVINDSAVIRHNVFTNNGADSISFERTGFGYAGFNTIEDSSDDGIDVDAREGTFAIEFNTIRNNGDDGIEVRLLTGSQPNITYDIHDNILSGNDEDGIQLIDHASDDSGRVFDIYNNVFDSNAMVGLGCMPDGNTTENFGGADIVERVNFYNNTVVNNAVGVTGGNNFIALNNIIANNTNEGVKRLRVDSVVAHSIFYNNGTPISDAITDAGIILDVDPDYDPVTYELLPASPSIDSGVATFVWNGELVLDIGPSEFVGPAPDLGAKEFGSGGISDNTAPTVSAGSDQVIFDPTNSTALQGQISDDGLPDPPGVVTTNWTQEGGPGAVTFVDASDPMTTVSFLQQGKYQLRLTGDDSELTASDSVVVRYANVGSGDTVPIQTPGTTFFEAEDYAYLYGTAQEVSDVNASGDVAVEAPDGFGADAFTEHTLVVTDQDVTFNVWIRGKGLDQSSDSVFLSFMDSAEIEVTLSSDNTYDWFQVPGSFTTSAGSWPLDIRAGEDGVIWDQVVFTTDPGFVPGENNIVEMRVAASSDDAEERANGSVSRSSSDLEFVFDRGGNQTVGMRFNGLDIPQGAMIASAWVQFQVDETNSGTTSLTIVGEDTDDAPTFTSSSGDISSRTVTGNSVSWDPLPWTTVGEAGPDQQTPDIALVIQEIVDRPGWSGGNALAIIVTGTGERTAESFNGAAAAAPLLHVEYVAAGSGTNGAPTVDAGPDQTVALPNSVALDGTVGDDGLPNPPGAVTTTWTMQSGPGTVTFGDDTAVDTTATFSDEGAYVLRLTADDGEFEALDELTVTVNQPGTQTLEVRVAAGTDDAEELPSGNMKRTSSDLDMVFDDFAGSNQTVGMRFNGVTIPQGSTIASAYVQFQVDETNSGTASLTIVGEDTDDAPTFTGSSGDISSRTVTGNVSWGPLPWTTKGQAGPDQQTPDIALVIQDIVDRPGWSSGNALVIIITGTGERVAESFDGVAAGAPLLHVEFTPAP